MNSEMRGSRVRAAFCWDMDVDGAPEPPSIWRASHLATECVREDRESSSVFVYKSQTFGVQLLAVDPSGEGGEKRKCGQMSSCAEAMFYLNTCGLKHLDADRDGVPCEALCRK